jgi:hypothetical protein
MFAMISTAATPQAYAANRAQVENFDFVDVLDNTPCGGEIIISQVTDNNFICTLS